MSKRSDGVNKADFSLSIQQNRSKFNGRFTYVNSYIKTANIFLEFINNMNYNYYIYNSVSFG